MLRSILVALDDTPGALAARDLAIALARHAGAQLSAAVILDDPHTRHAAEPVPPGGGAFLERRNAALAKAAEAAAAAALAAWEHAAGDLRYTALRLTDAPEPALRAACATHDLLVLGRDSTLGQEQAEDGLAPVVEALLHHGARPLLVVPPGAPRDGPVVIGYDGSLPCQRAVQLYALLRPATDAPVQVLSVDADAATAERLAAEAVTYLALHGIAAHAAATVGDRPVDALLGAVATEAARLVVMGAFETSGLRAFLLGSATRKLLRDLPCPVFVAN
jgi:nucleotide-binding universal stress UspA family protein